MYNKNTSRKPCMCCNIVLSTDNLRKYSFWVRLHSYRPLKTNSHIILNFPYYNKSFKLKRLYPKYSYIARKIIKLTKTSVYQSKKRNWHVKGMKLLNRTVMCSLLYMYIQNLLCELCERSTSAHLVCRMLNLGESTVILNVITRHTRGVRNNLQKVIRVSGAPVPTRVIFFLCSYMTEHSLSGRWIWCCCNTPLYDILHRPIV